MVKEIGEIQELKHLNKKKKLNFLIVTEAGDAWPSGYVRALIFKDYFKNNGYSVKYISRTLPYFTKIYNSSTHIIRFLNFFGFQKIIKFLNLIYSRLSHLRIVRLAREIDLIYLQKVGSYSLVKEIRKKSKCKLVYDLNDGQWLQPRTKHSENRVFDILKNVDAITCDNPFGVEVARQYNHYSFIVPDSSQVENFDITRKENPKNNSRIIIGWIGSPGTLFNLYLIWEALEKVFERRDNIHLRLVGTGLNPDLLPRFEKVNYSIKPFYNEKEMIREVLLMNIGLFPLFNVEDSFARGVLKATIYMSGGATVIASPIGQCNDLIQDGVNGLLAKDTNEWIDKLELVIENQKLREDIALAGLNKVRKEFSAAENFNKLLSVFNKCIFI